MNRFFWYLILIIIIAIAILLIYAVNNAPAGYNYQPYYGYQQNYQNYQNQYQNYYNYNQYQQQYYQPYYPAQKVYANEIAVAPLIVTVPVESKAVPVHAYGSPYYYSASDAYKEKAYMREVIREEFRNLLNTDKSTTNKSSTNSNTNKSTTPATPSKSKTNEPQAMVPDTTTPQDLQQKVLAAYSGKANCVSCHIDGGSNPFKLVMDDGKGNNILVKQTRERKWMIYGMASVGAMPPAAVNDSNKAMEAVHLPNLLQYVALKD